MKTITRVLALFLLVSQLLCTVANAERMALTFPLDGAQLVLDAEIWGKREKAAIYPCKTHEWDEARFAQALMGNKTYHKGTVQGDMGAIYPRYFTEDGTEMVVRQTSISFYTANASLLEGIAKNYAQYGESILHGAALEEADYAGFATFTPNDAIAAVLKLAQELDLPLCEERMGLIPLPAAIFTQVFRYYESQYEDFVMPDFSAPDCYWVVAPVQMDGIPQVMAPFSLRSEESFIDSVSINLLLSRDGILSATFPAWYEAAGAAEESEELLSPEEAAQALADALSMLLLERDIAIEILSLEYIPLETRQGWLLTPVWVFYTAPYYNEETGNYSLLSNYYIHAVTGEYLY